MKIKRAGWVGLAMAAGIALFAAACSSSDGTGPSGPGQLTVSVTTTGSGGSAFLITLNGAGISNPVAAVSGHQVYSFASGNTVKVAVLGSLSSGSLLRFTVPDISQGTTYSVSLDQVAGSDNALQSSGDYTLTIQ